MEKFNPQIPVRYGLVALGVAVTLGLLMYVFYQQVFASMMFTMGIGIFSFGILLFLGIWSGITYRRENGGVISFAHAFLAVFIVFVINIAGSNGTQLLINNVIDKQYAEKASSYMKEKMTDRFEKMNLDEAKIKESTKDINAETFNPPLLKQLKTISYSLLMMAVIAALVALFIKRGSSDIIDSGTPRTPLKTI